LCLFEVLSSLRALHQPTDIGDNNGPLLVKLSRALDSIVDKLIGLGFHSHGTANSGTNSGGEKVVHLFAHKAVSGFDATVKFLEDGLIQATGRVDLKLAPNFLEGHVL
jgi:hypothetical protein